MIQPQTRGGYFVALQKISNLIHDQKEQFERSPRVEYLIDLIFKIEGITNAAIKPDFEQIIQPLILELRTHKKNDSGRMACPRCGGSLIYTVGVLGSIFFKCKTSDDCIYWSEVNGE